ncbi:hypothetical protein ADIARSV_0532 [Arcticibacter svalbardensis MN12-7]|uniref:PKD-like family protein n=1 Tax=Arcticibacter svalbardensis MN12-7 TaxID=1150600 RepID=R9GWW2_9SPHI|nr:PKD-like family lipoprotein [Arcticibacter svalbardensis]EOR96297.1 hypothetical protein ADIARSV_0532 [Arcticibacter svalbardensis MN12-7]
MKYHKITYSIYAFLALLIALSSCKDDLSTLDINKIPGVTIDTAGQSNLNIFQFEHLVITPKINADGLQLTDLSYEWKINISPGSLEYEVIGTTRDLDYEVRLKPTEANDYHQILYTITDNKTGLQYIMAWPLAVRNSISEGLVIAETADGINTDISHIMSSLVTPDYNQVSVKHNVYSSINNATIPGIIKQMRYTNLKANGEIMMGITGNSLVTIKTLDYTPGPKNEDMFFTVPDAIKPQTLTGVSQVDVYVGNNQMHGVWLAISSKFGLPFASPYAVPGHIALDRGNNYPAVMLSFYDEVNGRFIYQPSITSFGDRNMYPVPSKSGEPFNPGSLPNQVNLAAGVTTDGDYMHLLKDKSTGKVGLYIINAGRNDEDYNLIPPYAKAIYDLSNAPDINEAIHFVLLDDQKVMYYATKTKIYAMLYGASTPSFGLRYTAANAEEITTLQIYQQADYPFRSVDFDPPYLSTNNKQLIMSTFSGTEGKVYLLPMTNPGVGNIDISKITTYGGFKKITAIAPQL